MDVTQPEIDALEQWAIKRRETYLLKGMMLAAANGSEVLAKYRDESLLSEKESAKSLADLKHEMLEADEFHKEAKRILHGGRQGG